MCSFFFNDPATTEIYTLSLHDALPICPNAASELPSITMARVASTGSGSRHSAAGSNSMPTETKNSTANASRSGSRSEEHTSELQSLAYLVCRLLLEKKKKKK